MTPVIPFGPIGHGGAERMIVYPVMLWLVAFGGYLLAPSPESLANRDGETRDSNR